MSLVAKVRRFRERNGGELISRVPYELAQRAYLHAPVRRVVTMFTPVREPRQWLFPVGCYNSGTTITRSILAAHPEVRGMPREGVRFTSELPRPEDTGWTRMWIRCPEHMAMPPVSEPERYRRIVRDWSPWWQAGGSAFMDKSITNVTRMPWLDLNFPGAYFLGIVRNGYCAAEGICRRAAPHGAARAAIGDRYPMSLAAEQWVASNEVMFGDAASVRRFMWIRYEDLVSDPIEILRGFWDFAELPQPRMAFSDGRLRIGDTEIGLRNMNASSLARLSGAEIEEANAVMAPWLEKLGYEVLSAEGARS